jgi:NAD(P)-dependent dehydrogenase (short-subunit alcohol dehydrogenase family)
MKKLILITGANRGIGFEMARQLGKLGHHVIISGRSESKLKLALEKLQKEKIEVEGLLMDVSDEKSILFAAKEFSEKKLKLDVLVNNAAIGLKGDRSILQNDDALLTETLNTNCTGPLRVCKAFLPLMNSPARIVNVSSGGGSMTDPVGGWSPAYCVSKSLLNALTRHLAYELESKNISVNAVCPGWVRTDMGGSAAPRSVAEGAETPVWLATEAPQNLTGIFFRDKSEIPW